MQDFALNFRIKVDLSSHQFVLSMYLLYLTAAAFHRGDLHWQVFMYCNFGCIMELEGKFAS